MKKIENKIPEKKVVFLHIKYFERFENPDSV